MEAVREYAVIKNRQLVLKLPESFDNKDVEVLVLPKDALGSQKISPRLPEDSLKTKSDTEDREQKNKELTRLFRSWREDEDEGEQRETWEYLKQVLDEDRLSDRSLFP